MKTYARQSLAVRPEFDIELFMAMSQEFKLDGKLVELLGEYWGKWLGLLKVDRFSDGEEGYLLIRLDDKPGCAGGAEPGKAGCSGCAGGETGCSVEAEVQRVWDQSPHRGFLLHNLAQALVMAAARMLIPDLVEAGCAPLPAPEEGLRKALAEVGLEWTKRGGLSNMYSILTPHPFAGGCSACFLRKNCPNLKQTGQPVE
jgi:hypothetical protein